jgi:hypothetical protein
MRGLFSIIFKDCGKIFLCLVFSLFLFSSIIVSLSEPCHAACTDNDSDGYGNPGDASCPNGSASDCNDSNAAIHPGAAEKCNGVDDDCDGQIDEGFVFGPCYLDPNGNQVLDPDGKSSLTKSFYECNASGTGTYCPVPASGLYQPTPEVPYTQSCHDGLDNDGDGLIDGADPDCVVTEQCNGLDDDYDGQTDEDFTCSTCKTGVHVGDTCTVGTGACERTGTVICLSVSSAGCSIAAGTPKSEHTPGTGNCVDGKDNDCDGFVDLADSGCQTAEKCDGIDNDGDGLVDEDFPDKGASCNNGLSGACYAEGIKVCKPDGTTTICNAVAPLASTEGPTGATCSDGKDNDCNGLVDGADPA